MRYFFALAAVLALLVGWCVLLDRFPGFADRLHDRMVHWPFRGMPTTNGSIISILYFGGLMVMLYLLGRALI